MEYKILSLKSTFPDFDNTVVKCEDAPAVCDFRRRLSTESACDSTYAWCCLSDSAFFSVTRQRRTRHQQKRRIDARGLQMARVMRKNHLEAARHEPQTVSWKRMRLANAWSLVPRSICFFFLVVPIIIALKLVPST